MARATKNSISGGLLGSEPQMTAYDAIASTLPKGAARWPMQRDRGQCFIQVEAAVVDRMRAMRRPG